MRRKQFLIRCRRKCYYTERNYSTAYVYKTLKFHLCGKHDFYYDGTYRVKDSQAERYIL